uniref:Acetylserotonin O-methyltransferase n=1 Tax=Mus musculus molossinus TaxID=57486 RepID=ASMT_MUSMM|nr:RecName: Full=Acetylserotonin O-methyltransferase; AltName: Full=Hydroxyindole O-methyltransferase [Mus musculus molossinus]BAI82193.1 hydroxyindole O-methyltransfease [Mus musculus molossinus]BDB45827.1 acetylserotonin O-methyltransferase [Mus musculus molossinus]BDB45836.1 acetylserotonin O-methyltransferase [Mus musculus molossinus]
MHRGRSASARQERDFRALMDLAHGFMASQVLFAGCALRVFDAAALGPVDAAALARSSGLSPRGTRLLLDACAGLGLLRRRRGAGPRGPAYTNSPLASTFLVAGSPLSQRSLLLYLAGTTYLCWGHLADGVREGRSQYARAVGVDADDPFTAIYRSEAERLLFMRGLQETWSLCGGRVLAAFDLSPFRVICDLGGGSGALARMAARLYPGSEVTVFETPDVVAAARAHFPPPADEDGAEPRVRFLSGDFFRSPLPPADLYVLARVLHDWADAACVELLRRVRGALRPGGAVLLVESVLSPGGAGPTRTLLLSLTMLLQARGRERTEAEYRALTARAGFSRLRLRRPRGPYHAMMAARGGGAGARSDGGGGEATSQTGSGTGREVGAQD